MRCLFPHLSVVCVASIGQIGCSTSGVVNSREVTAVPAPPEDGKGGDNTLTLSALDDGVRAQLKAGYSLEVVRIVNLIEDKSESTICFDYVFESDPKERKTRYTEVLDVGGSKREALPGVEDAVRRGHASPSNYIVTFIFQGGRLVGAESRCTDPVEGSGNKVRSAK